MFVSFVPRMALQVYRSQESFEVAALAVEQVAWFKGAEVAACLGYANVQKAVKTHVEDEDKKSYEELLQGGLILDMASNKQPHEIYVNESGLYSLVLRSKKPL